MPNTAYQVSTQVRSTLIDAQFKSDFLKKFSYVSSTKPVHLWQDRHSVRIILSRYLLNSDHIGFIELISVQLSSRPLKKFVRKIDLRSLGNLTGRERKIVLLFRFNPEILMIEHFVCSVNYLNYFSLFN